MRVGALLLAGRQVRVKREEILKCELKKNRL